jgi:hypothetical protein
MNVFSRTGFLLIALVAAICAIAADSPIAGKWSGTVEVNDPGSGTVVSAPITITFDEPQGPSVSGKISSNDEEVPIKNGKIEGDHLTFEASSADTSGPVKFTLKISADQMQGAMKGTLDTGEIAGTVKVTKDK